MLRRSYDDAPIGYVPFFAALKINGSWQFFVTVKCATGDAGNLLIVDNRLTGFAKEVFPDPTFREYAAATNENTETTNTHALLCSFIGSASFLLGKT
jgi:hypothetical protein